MIHRESFATSASNPNFEAHAALAAGIGAKRARASKLDALAIDEYANTALIGLWEASKRFDPARGASFRTFALRRVHGKILDTMRDADVLTRYERLKGDVTRTITSIDGEMADGKKRIFCDERGADPSDRLQAAELLQKIVASVPKKARIREAFVLYFFERMKMKAIGERLGISESRVCQLIGVARDAIRPLEQEIFA